MEPQEIDSALDELENRLDRLRSLYEQYFMGIEKIEPTVPRKDVDRRFWILRRTQIRNTARRFRLQTLTQRYNTFQQHWTRICREIENGTYVRHLLKARKNLGAEPKTWAAKKRLGLLRRDRVSGAPPDGADAAAAPSDAPAPDGAAGTAPPSRMPASAPPSGMPAGAPDRIPLPSPAAARVPQDFGVLDLDLDDAPTLPPPRPARPEVPRRVSSRPPAAANPVAQPAASPFAAPKPPAIPKRVVLQPAVAAATPAAASPKAPVAPGAVAAPRAPAAPAAASPLAPRVPNAAPTANSAVKAQPAAPVVAAAAPTAKAAPAAPANAALRPAPAAAARPTPPRPTSSRPPPSPTAQSPAAAAGQPVREQAPLPAAAARPAQGPAQRPERPAPAEAPAAAARPVVALSDERVKQLHADLSAARKQLNQSSNLSVDSLAKSLRETESKLRAQHGGRSVDFQVVIKDGKPIVKPVVRR